jgi:pyruvate/2-oxoglutarate dehydrogenase complex dihydrolipoamide acyltransferase (E2) component
MGLGIGSSIAANVIASGRQPTSAIVTAQPATRTATAAGTATPPLGRSPYATSAISPALERPPGTSLFDPARGALAQNFQPGGYCHEDGPCHDSIYIPDISGGDFARAGTAIATSFQRLWRSLTPAATGGAAAVRTGQAGEAAVRAAFDIGEKVPIQIAGRTRIPDGLTSTVLSEVKNVQSLSYTQQLRDFAEYASQNDLRFDLYVRSTTQLSGPLAQEVANGAINLRFIP